MAESTQLNMKDDIRFTAQITLCAIGIGLLFILFQQLIQDYHRIFFSLFWSLACLISGGGVGFLFGIPRFLQTDAEPIAHVNALSGAEASSQALPRRNANYRPNTNLDRISDWLTTIIVGLGLVEIRKVIWGFNQAAGFIALGMGGEEQRPIAGAIIIYFSLVGFLGAYLVTRLYLAQIFKGVDDGLGVDDGAKHKLLTADLSDPGRINLKADAESVARQIVDRPLNQLASLTDIVAWSKAQLNAQNFEKAVIGYKRAIEIAPTDIQLRLEYSNALYYAGESSSSIEKRTLFWTDSGNQLSEAYKLLNTSSDSSTRMKVYRALTFHHLFDTPPEGFRKTIKYATEYIELPVTGKIESGGIWVNLACAYGQQWKWSKETEKADQKTLDTIRDKAYEATVRALELDIGWLGRFRTLLQKNISKDPEDNDLEVFENDAKFRRLLDLPELANEETDEQTEQ